MTIREFEVLTGFHPPMSLYEVIERDYESSTIDKYEYCEAYKTDKDGMAERLARIVDKLGWEQTDRATKELNRLRKELTDTQARLTETQTRLDRELDWQPATDIGTNMSEQKYAELADDEPPLSDLEAIRRVHKECGFDMAYIQIITTVHTFDKNKHGKCRVSGEYSRRPVWSSSDWNYIRFNVADMQWELVNGELCQYFD